MKYENIGITQKTFIFDEDGKFLILRRTKTAPSKPNNWDLPGGAIEIGEDAGEAIVREIKEETGLQVEDLKPFDVYSEYDEDDEFWVSIAYFAKTKSKKVKLSFEHDEFKWVTPEEFKNYSQSKRFLRFLKKL